jgi:hypothetical protein
LLFACLEETRVFIVAAGRGIGNPASLRQWFRRDQASRSRYFLMPWEGVRVPITLSSTHSPLTLETGGGLRGSEQVFIQRDAGAVSLTKAAFAIGANLR